MSNAIKDRPSFILPAFCAMALAFAAYPVSAAVTQVTNTTDSGAGSLRNSFNFANTNAGSDEIIFNGASGLNNTTITLGSNVLSQNGLTTLNTSFLLSGGSPDGVTLTITGSAIDLGAIDSLNTYGNIVINSNIIGTNGALVLYADTANSHVATVTLGGTVSVTGGLSITNGVTLQAASAASLGGNYIAIYSTAVFKPTASYTITQKLFAVNGATFNTNGFDITLSGLFGDAGVLNKTGAGTLTFTSSASNNSGGININAGTVVATDSAALGTGTITLNGGTFKSGAAGLTFGNAFAIGAGGGTIDTNGNDLTVSTAVTGTGAIVKQGAGILTLSGNNNYSGGTTIAGGTISFQSSTAGGTGTITTTGSVIDYADGINLSNAININSNTTQVQVSTGTATQSGVISQTGGARPLEKIGVGTLILSANNTYTGSTTITAGKLQIGAGGTTGSMVGPVSVTSNGTLVFNRSDATTYAGNISGAGSVTIAGTGTTTFTGTNNYTGQTNLNGGTLAIGATSAIGSSFIIFDGGALKTTNITSVSNNIVVNNAGGNIIGDTNNITYSGNITGTRDLTLTAGAINTTVFNLTGNNSAFTGGLILSNAYVTVANATNVGTGTITQQANSAQFLMSQDMTLSNNFVFNATNFNDIDITAGHTATLSGNLSGSGSRLIVDGGGTLILTGTSTFAGTIETGPAHVTGNASNIIGNVTDDGQLNFNQTTDGTYNGNVSGSGTFTKLGSGKLTLSGSIANTGGITVSAGTLSIGSGGTSGSVVGNIVDNASLIFNRSDAYTYAGNISGTGSVTQAGSGTTTLSGTNTYSGGKSINAGTLQAQAAASVGSASIAMANGTTLKTGGSFTLSNNIGLTGTDTIHTNGNNNTLSGVISGAGNLTKAGVGTLTLTNASNTYSGVTSVTQGTLALSGVGSISSSSGVDISSGATFDISGASSPIGKLSGSGNVVLGGSILTTNFSSPTTAEFSGTISGGGMLIKSGSGQFTLTGSSTNTGGINIQAGTLSIGNGGTSGSVSGAITNFGKLIINRSDSYVYDNGIGGIGTVDLVGSGTVTLNRQNNDSGLITVNAGKLQIGDSTHTFASVAGNVNVSGGTLTGYGTIGGNVTNGAN
ncbi:MAG: autotransporter-associated beta strand repeat-containing protein, partial [Alphaproteobacteria bacterium]|nr:autotransporter-associated beta strand repeat-containing protein [Alphaproteobacteria bacterium]